MKQLSKLAALAMFVWVGAAEAGVLVTLSATDADGQPVSGNVEVGETIVVDIYLSVDADAEPLPDIRLIQFDFTASSDTIDVSDFLWMLDVPGGDVMYGFQIVNLPKPAATYTGQTRAEGLILDLTTVPVRVAGFNATVNGSGSLDVIGSIDGGFTRDAAVHAGFDTRVVFSLDDATLSGGRLELTIGGGGTPVDSDGDGVPDSADAFPNDPSETTDSDGDGIGDVADAFPDDPTKGGDGDGGSGGGSPGGGQVPTLCGGGAAPAMILMLLTFGGVRMRRRV